MDKAVTKRGPRLKGICADAQALGVTYQHLWAVLKKKRQSKSLIRRYRRLKVSQRGEAAHGQTRP